jgi:hypothetical protein
MFETSWAGAAALKTKKPFPAAVVYCSATHEPGRRLGGKSGSYATLKM